jgi:NitT/TauT family transport system substrate-binding protein
MASNIGIDKASNIGIGKLSRRRSLTGNGSRMKSRRTVGVMAPAVLLVSLLMVVAGCTSSSPSSSASSTTNTATKAPATTVNFVYFPGSLTYLPVFVGIQKGFFQAQNINVSLIKGSSVSALATAIATGAADATWQNVGYWANLSLSGVDVKMVGPYEAVPWVVVVPNSDHTTPVPGVHGATWQSMLKSFAGKTIGGLAGTNVAGAQYLFTLAGLQTGSVNVLGIGTEAAQVAALGQGQVSALLTVTGWASGAVTTGTAKIINNLADPGHGPPIFKDSTITTTGFNNAKLLANPTLAKRWYSAMQSTLAFMSKKSNGPALAAILGNYGITAANTPGLPSLIDTTVQSTVATLTTAQYNGAMTFGKVTNAFSGNPPSAKKLVINGLTQ